MPDTALDPAFALAQQRVLDQRELLAKADPDTLRLLFTEARTHYRWQDRPVSDALLKDVFELAKWAPTAANLQPLRYLHIRSSEAKERLRPAISASNLAKVMSAPVTTVIAYDPKFYEQSPRIFPIFPGIADSFSGNEAVASLTAERSSMLQAAYFILAARAKGLDAGPMAGFDAAKINAEFFAESGWKANLVVNIGYGDVAGVTPRLPRLDFEDVSAIL